MKLRTFSYARARSTDDALALWQESDAMFISGGQGLLSEMALGLRRPERLVDVSAVAALSAIEPTEGGVRIGAAVTLGRLARESTSPDPLLRAAARHVGVEPVRTLATVGGNFCHGNATAELPLAALVAGAHILGISPDGSPVRLDHSAWSGLPPSDDVSPIMVTALEWPRRDTVTATGFVEIGLQATFVPETAIAWMIAPGDEGVPAELRVGVAVREGGRFLITADGRAPSPDDVAAAMESAGVETGLSPSWLSAVIDDAVGADRVATTATREATR